MEDAKFIKKENDLAEYELKETTKGAKGVNGKEYKEEKIERSKSNER